MFEDPSGVLGGVAVGPWGFPGLRGRSLGGPLALWSSLGSPWEIVGASWDPGGRLWRPGEDPRRSWELLERDQEAPKTHKVFSGCLVGIQGTPWGDLGHLEWSLRLTWKVELLILGWL